MGDMGDIFREMTKADKERRWRNLDRAKDSPIQWTKHTDYHWSIELDGDRLDYWPSTTRHRWRGVTRTGGIEGFIKNRMPKEAKE